MPPEADVELVRTLVAVTRQQHDWLRTKAFHARTSIAAEIRELVQAAMDKEPSSGRTRASGKGR